MAYQPRDPDRGVYCRICRKRIYTLAELNHTLTVHGTYTCTRCAPMRKENV